MSSSLFRHNNSSNNPDNSADLDDLRQQNRYLYEQNLTLKKSLEQLISINTELTQSIEEFNNSHVENFPHINQQQIEQLALRVIELEQELEKERGDREKDREREKQREKERERGTESQHSENNGSLEETLKVIEELMNSFRVMQQQYSQQLQRMQGELQAQKNQWGQMSQSIEEKLSYFQKEYSKVIVQMRQMERNRGALQAELQERARANGGSRKEMKISTTIEDLRVTLQRQIEQKDRIIKNYQHVIEGIKGKLSQKINY